MRIRAATPADDAAWDAFVDAAPDATFFHQSAWRSIIERAFRSAISPGRASITPSI